MEVNVLEIGAPGIQNPINVNAYVTPVIHPGYMMPGVIKNRYGIRSMVDINLTQGIPENHVQFVVARGRVARLEDEDRIVVRSTGFGVKVLRGLRCSLHPKRDGVASRPPNRSEER